MDPRFRVQQRLRFMVKESGFRIWGVGFRGVDFRKLRDSGVQDLEFTNLGFRVQGIRVQDWDLWFRVQGAGCRVQGAGHKVQA